MLKLSFHYLLRLLVKYTSTAICCLVCNLSCGGCKAERGGSPEELAVCPPPPLTVLSPENGERPQFIRTRAIDVSFDGKEGEKAGHVSDMRSVCGGEGWKRSPRDAESI